MQINWLHQVNQAGKELVSYLKSAWDSVICSEINIEGSNYYDIVACKGTGDFTWTLNSLKGILNTRDEAAIQAMLGMNGMDFLIKQSEVANKSYEILICDLNVISVKQKTFGKSSSPVKYVSEKTCEKAVSMAKKAAFLAGLDYAMVKVILNGKTKLKIENINASPVLRSQDFEDLINVIEQSSQKRIADRQQEIILGADPEFMMVNLRNGKMIPASEFFPREGMVGCDNIRIPSRQQRPVAEIRPKPDLSPLQLSGNIKKALQHAGKMAPYRNVKWLAGSQPCSGFSIGGHIHFSNVSLNCSLLRALDNYLALPIFLIEDQASAVKRRKKYGSLADYRIKEHGGFEYRTPGSWLISPEITGAVLCLAKIVVSNYALLFRNIFNGAEAQQAFYNGDQSVLVPKFEEIWKDVTSLPIYETYQNELQIIPQMIQSQQCWDENTDIRKAWNVPQKGSKSYQNSRVGEGKSSTRSVSQQRMGRNGGGQSSTTRTGTSQRGMIVRQSTQAHVNGGSNGL